MASKSEPEPVSPCFKAGSAVEISSGDGGLWFSGDVIRWLTADKLYVEYHYLFEDEEDPDPRTEVLSLHRLRPRPPPEINGKFEIGDKVDVLDNVGWQECYVTEDLGDGRFGVWFEESKEKVVFSEKKLRLHRDWIDNNWVPPITIKSTKAEVSARRKEIDLYLRAMRTWKRRRGLGGNREENERDRISELPDNILLHILKFMDTKSAVATCLLSKRWKDLCKRLTNLTFNSVNKREVEIFRNFASWVQFTRDDSYSLFHLEIRNWIDPQVLDSVVKYAMSHSVQQLKINIQLSCTPNFETLPLIFCYQGLTSLQLSVQCKPSVIILPNSLQLPALKTLQLGHVNFAASDNGVAEPFSNCPVLDTLELSCCSLHESAKSLCISNSILSSLAILSFVDVEAYEVALTTPNLSSFTINGFAAHQLSSTCNLSQLGEAYINVSDDASSLIIGWLKMLSNAKKLKFSSSSMRVILDDISNPSLEKTEAPHFVRLESLKVEKQLYAEASDEEMDSVVKYLLQNTNSERVDVRIISLGYGFF